MDIQYRIQITAITQLQPATHIQMGHVGKIHLMQMQVLLDIFVVHQCINR